MYHGTMLSSISILKNADIPVYKSYASWPRSWPRMQDLSNMQSKIPECNTRCEATIQDFKPQSMASCSPRLKAKMSRCHARCPRCQDVVAHDQNISISGNVAYI